MATSRLPCDCDHPSCLPASLGFPLPAPAQTCPLHCHTPFQRLSWKHKWWNQSPCSISNVLNLKAPMRGSCLSKGLVVLLLVVLLSTGFHRMVKYPSLYHCTYYRYWQFARVQGCWFGGGSGLCFFGYFFSLLCFCTKESNIFCQTDIYLMKRKDT